MKVQGAVIKEQGVSFAIVIVKQFVIQSQIEFRKVVTSFSNCFPGMPIVLMCNGSHLKTVVLAFNANFCSNLLQIKWYLCSHYLQMSLHLSALARIPFSGAQINCK